MPQHTQHILIHVLLLWTTILSIIQVVFTIIFFTVGHHGPPQNNRVEVPERTMQFQTNNTTSSPPEGGPLFGKGKMLTFQATDDTVATDDNKRIKWIAKNPDTSLVSEGELLHIQKDGYYFLILQVTLCSCGRNQTLSLKWNGELLLSGRINEKLCSTGLLGKVAVLSAGGTLDVTINPKTRINISESVTHLDFIYMLKP